MHSIRLCGMAAAFACGTVSISGDVQSASAVKMQRDGSITMDGHALRCSSRIRNVLDANLPNLGVAAPGRLVMNPYLLQQETQTVRLFVFYHECGHHHVGGDEMKADCWAVDRGVQEGWLDKAGLREVCKSFHNDPPTSTHPSGRSRCANLDRCFASASQTLARRRAEEAQVASLAASTRQRRDTGTEGFASSRASGGAPRLLSGPTLVRDGWAPTR
jgi:hypothetical protein